ncbi:MAG: lipopolysaccharide biosynthesis protein [Eggerthellaceae bacterium]
MTEDLKAKASRGFAWSVAERFLTQGTLFVVSVVLARLLSPTEYGTIAMLLVFVNLADVLVTNGLGEALIQKKSIEQVDYSTILLCGSVLSLFLYILIFIAAPFIGSFYDDPSMTLLLRILALRMPLASFNAIQKAYVAKNFLFRKQFLSSFFGSFLSGGAAIVLALLGYGVFALIAQQLLTVVLCSIFLLASSKWVPGFRFSGKSCGELFPLGLQFAGANLINALYSEGRSLLIGKYYSPAQLALFNRGNQFPSLIVNNINTPISNVLLPVMSEVKDDGAKLRNVVKKAIQLAAFFIFPLMGYLIVAAGPLVDFLLGQQWLGCVVYLQVACVFYLFQPLQTMNWQVLKAVGRGDLCFKLEVLKKSVGFGLLFASVPFGVFWIAAASAVFGALSMLINMAPNKKIIGYAIAEQLKDMVKPFVSTGIAMAFGMIPLYLELPSLLTLVVQALTGLLIYLVVSKVVKSEGLSIIVSEVRVRRSKGEANA